MRGALGVVYQSELATGRLGPAWWIAVVGLGLGWLSCARPPVSSQRRVFQALLLYIGVSCCACAKGYDLDAEHARAVDPVGVMTGGGAGNALADDMIGSGGEVSVPQGTPVVPAPVVPESMVGGMAGGMAGRSTGMAGMPSMAPQPAPEAMSEPQTQPSAEEAAQESDPVPQAQPDTRTTPSPAPTPTARPSAPTASPSAAEPEAEAPTCRTAADCPDDCPLFDEPCCSTLTRRCGCNDEGSPLLCR